MNSLYYLIPLIAGLAVAVQAGVNTELQSIVKSPLVSGLISFLVGTTTILLAIFFTNYRSLANISNVNQATWWQLTGGIMGAIYICSLIIAVPKIGAANMMGFAVAAQLIFAVLFDHFGWIGFPIHHITWQRILGVAMLLVGLYFIKK